MIEIIQEYWKSLLWTDGYRFTGVAITLWLLIASRGDGRHPRGVSGHRPRVEQ
ncbi:Histidine transport system permease protein hisM [Pluralibacter gergoviae]|nr:Histidine transport system permease protein hisM [Pluralibacter gergoviae]